MQYVQYRGGSGMLAWAFHRISGVAVWLFIILHVFSIWLVGADPELYDQLHAVYATPVWRVAELLLGAALLYHALNGLRVIVMDFWPALTIYHRQLWIAVWIVFFVVGIPVSLILAGRIAESI
jgi:succinate dehydrogenase / fumarate reductase cytochrome b subunit